MGWGGGVGVRGLLEDWERGRQGKGLSRVLLILFKVGYCVGIYYSRACL